MTDNNFGIQKVKEKEVRTDLDMVSSIGSSASTGAKIGNQIGGPYGAIIGGAIMGVGQGINQSSLKKKEERQRFSDVQTNKFIDSLSGRQIQDDYYSPTQMKKGGKIKSKYKIAEIEGDGSGSKEGIGEIVTDKDYNLRAVANGSKTHQEGGEKVAMENGDVVFPTQKNKEHYKKVLGLISKYNLNGDKSAKKELDKIKDSLPSEEDYEREEYGKGLKGKKNKEDRKEWKKEYKEIKPELKEFYKNNKETKEEAKKFKGTEAEAHFKGHTSYRKLKKYTEVTPIYRDYFNKIVNKDKSPEIEEKKNTNPVVGKLEELNLTQKSIDNTKLPFRKFSELLSEDNQAIADKKGEEEFFENKGKQPNTVIDNTIADKIGEEEFFKDKGNKPTTIVDNTNDKLFPYQSPVESYDKENLPFRSSKEILNLTNNVKNEIPSIVDYKFGQGQLNNTTTTKQTSPEDNLVDFMTANQDVKDQQELAKRLQEKGIQEKEYLDFLDKINTNNGKSPEFNIGSRNSTLPYGNVGNKTYNAHKFGIPEDSKEYTEPIDVPNNDIPFDELYPKREETPTTTTTEEEIDRFNFEPIKLKNNPLRYSSILNNLMTGNQQIDPVTKRFLSAEELDYKDLSYNSRRASLEKRNAIGNMFRGKGLSAGQQQSYSSQTNKAYQSEQEAINEKEAQRFDAVNQYNIGQRNQLKATNLGLANQYDEQDAQSKAVAKAYEGQAYKEMSDLAESQTIERYQLDRDNKALEIQQQSIPLYDSNHYGYENGKWNTPVYKSKKRVAKKEPSTTITNTNGVTSTKQVK